MSILNMSNYICDGANRRTHAEGRRPRARLCRFSKCRGSRCGGAAAHIVLCYTPLPSDVTDT